MRIYSLDDAVMWLKLCITIFLFYVMYLYTSTYIHSYIYVYEGMRVAKKKKLSTYEIVVMVK